MVSIGNSQDVEPCHVDATKENKEMLKFLDKDGAMDHKRLVKVLKDHKFDIPEDYFDLVDHLGLYRGEKLTAKILKKRYKEKNKDDKNKNDELGGGYSINSIYPDYKYIPVHVWVHEDAAGNPAVTRARLFDVLGTAFRQFHEETETIQLFLLHVTYVEDSPHFIMGNENEEKDLYRDYRNWNAINVHIVSQGPGNGSADGIGSYNCWVDDGSAMETLTHELGHMFGLRHTHEGTAFCDNNDACSNCYQESVSRTRTQGFGCGFGIGKRKCEVNGDKLCDTPADPNTASFVDAATCTYSLPNRDLTDNWGDFWNPPTTNIMSNSARARNNVQCRNDFSIGQTGVMLDVISSNSSSYNVETTHDQVILGPSTLCPGSTYTYTAPTPSDPQNWSNNDFIWEFPQGWTITSPNVNASQVTVQVPNNVTGSHTIFVHPVPDDGTILSNFGFSVAPKVVTTNNNVFISGPSTINGNSYCNSFSTPGLPGASYFWYTNAPFGSGVNICSGQGTNIARVEAHSNSNNFTLYVNVSNICGTASFTDSHYVEVSHGGDGTPIQSFPSEKPVISLGPNPSSDYVDFKIGNTNSIKNVEIYEMRTGKKLVIKDCLDENENRLDISSLKSGLYIIRYSQNGKFFTDKILKR